MGSLSWLLMILYNSCCLLLGMFSVLWVQRPAARWWFRLWTYDTGGTEWTYWLNVGTLRKGPWSIPVCFRALYWLNFERIPTIHCHLAPKFCITFLKLFKSQVYILLGRFCHYLFKWFTCKFTRIVMVCARNTKNQG